MLHAFDNQFSKTVLFLMRVRTNLLYKSDKLFVSASIFLKSRIYWDLRLQFVTEFRNFLVILEQQASSTTVILFCICYIIYVSAHYKI